MKTGNCLCGGYMELEKINSVLLDRSCNTKDVTFVIIDQINGLQHDIEDLEQMRTLLKDTFNIDDKSYRNAHIIENKIKTFTGFYTTILQYKRELNFMILKLRELLDGGGSVEEFKIALRQVLSERNTVKVGIEENKQRINEIVNKNPNLMPSKL